MCLLNYLFVVAFYMDSSHNPIGIYKLQTYPQHPPLLSSKSYEPVNPVMVAEVLQFVWNLDRNNISYVARRWFRTRESRILVLQRLMRKIDLNKWKMELGRWTNKKINGASGC